MGSLVGAQKIAAKRAGMDLTEYQRRIGAGLKSCWKCQEWKAHDNFSRDRHRSDGLKAICVNCDRVQIKRERIIRRPSTVIGNRASHAVRRAVKAGALKPINEQSCIRCDSQAAHYHHENGYEPEHLLDVIPLCASCHHKEHWDG